MLCVVPSLRVAGNSIGEPRTGPATSGYSCAFVLGTAVLISLGGVLGQRQRGNNAKSGRLFTNEAVPGLDGRYFGRGCTVGDT